MKTAIVKRNDFIHVEAGSLVLVLSQADARRILLAVLNDGEGKTYKQFDRAIRKFIRMKEVIA